MHQGGSANFFSQITKVRILVLIALMVLMGFWLRTFNLHLTGLWMDELHSVVGADPGKTAAQVIEYSKQDQPPLFFLILHAWFHVFSYNDHSGQILVALIGCGGIIAMYFVGKEYKNVTVGLVAAFLTAINYFHIDASRQVRFYPLVFLLSALSFLFFLRIIRRGKAEHFLLYILSTSALLNTHYFGLVVFASQFLIFLIIIFWKTVSDVSFLARCFLSGLAVALSFSHWLPVVISDLGIPQFHAQKLQWYFPALFHWVYFKDIVTATICAALIGLALWHIFSAFKQKNLTIQQVVLVGWVSFTVLIPLLYSLLRMPMLEYKYTFITLPGIFLLIAAGLEAIPLWKVRGLIILVLFVSFFTNAMVVKPIYYAKPVEHWREVTKAVLQSESDDQVVFSYYSWYYRYYFKVFGAKNQPLEPQYADFETWLNRSDKVWVLISTRFPDAGLSKEQEDRLNKEYNLEKELTFSDTIARLYRR